MSIIIFFIILSALIIVHELGHFLVAKKFGIRVDEFGLGYPPRAKKLFSWWGTDFTLNWLPFGGFVKIFGENPDSAEAEEVSSESFQSKNRGIQASVLAAGVFFNFLFAWLLISLGFMTGIPSPAGLSVPLENPRTIITLVVPGSPADLGGLKSGDAIGSLSRGNDVISATEDAQLSPQIVSEFISLSPEPITFSINRGETAKEVTVTPATDIIAERPAVGIAMETIGTVQLPPHQAFWHGLKTTWAFTVFTAKAIATLISQAFVGKADLGAVTGPVGIVGMVGDMKDLGWSYLVTFTALLSINLSIINLLPFPALDGGRLLFVGIETITRRPIPARFFNAVNAAGFALLIFLMILITIRDVRNIF
ncbi:MAG: M50 family metallopeptidase [Candidatus Zambryskibacteria bacterium]|nr:M50 family metallopeptidase [Candidatus Zambryskibacteria bacterium]